MKIGWKRTVVVAVMSAIALTTNVSAYSLQALSDSINKENYTQEVEQKDNKKYQITFDANGGQGTMDNAFVEDEGALPYNTFTNGDKKFIGWAKNKDATDPNFVDGGAFFGTSDTTLYALWSDNAHLLSFNPNGATKELKDIYVNAGDTIVLPDARGKLLYDGAKFDGWSLEYNGLRKYGNRSSLTMEDKDLTLYALWRLEDLNVGGNYPEFANTTQWARGITPPAEDEWITSPSGEPAASWKEGYGFYDVWQQTYGLCWAASAANMLHYWIDQNKEYIDRYEKQYPSDYSKGGISAIFNEMIDEFADDYLFGGSQSFALSWFLNGSDKHPGTGAYFKDVFKNNSIVDGGVVTAQKFNEMMNRMFTEGGVVGFAFASHAFTLWGATYNSDGFVDGIYYTNSNDNGSPGGGVYELLYEPVYYIDGKPTVINGVGEWDAIEHLNYLGLGQDIWEDYFENQSQQNPNTDSNDSSKLVGTQERVVNNEQELKSALNDTNVKTVKLNSDITVKETQLITTDKVIDFNGHTITGFRGGSVFKVGNEKTNGIKVEFKDTNKGKSKNGNAVVGGIKGGNGQSKTAGAISIVGSNTSVTINGGLYQNNIGRVGGAIHVNSKDAVVTMNNGMISNNKAVSSDFGRGGGVYVQNGKFVMNGGSIIENTSDYLGGGVAVNSGATFELNAGEIKQNNVNCPRGDVISGGGGGIAAVSTNANIVLNGGTITENTIEGANVYGGGIRDYKNSVTIGGPVQITNNVDKGLTYPSNLVLLNEFEETPSSAIKINSLDQDNQKANIGIQFYGYGVGKFVEDVKNKDMTQYFKSDVNEYSVTSDGTIKKNKDIYDIIIENNKSSITYGSSGKFKVYTYHNGVLKSNSEVSFVFENQKEVKGYSNGAYSDVTVNPVSSQLDFKLGENNVKCVWKENGKVLTEKDITINFTPSIIYNDEIIWNNLENRVEGDGKEVTATFKPGAILDSDKDLVKIVLNNSKIQEKGTHKAYISYLEGEKSKYYTLSYGTPIEFWQKEYVIEKSSENATVISVFPQEQTISPLENASYDVNVSVGGVHATGGEVQLQTLNGDVLATSDVQQDGTSQLNYVDDSTLPKQTNSLQVVYYPNKGDTQNKHTAPVSLTISNKNLEELTFDGTLEAKDTYGVSFNDLKIKADKQPTNKEGQEVPGSWKWKVRNLSDKPGASENIEHMVVFIPSVSQGEYKELTAMLDPDIAKAEQPLYPSNPRFEEITHNSIILKEFVSKVGTETVYRCDNGPWQTSRVFTDLKPNTTYTFEQKYLGNENYLEASLGLKESRTTKPAPSQTMNIDEKPTATSHYGVELQDIKLEGGKVSLNGKTVTGKWMWDGAQDLHQLVNVNNDKEYKVAFKPDNSGSLGMLTTTIVPNITIANQDKPPVPTLVTNGVTSTSITVKQIVSPYNTNVMYKIDNGEWQSQNTFSNLTPNTEYTIYVKYEGNNNYKESDISFAKYKTLDDTPAPVEYKIDVNCENSNVTYGEDLVFNINVTANNQPVSNGVVKMYVDNKEVTSVTLSSPNTTQLTYKTTDKKLSIADNKAVDFVYESQDNKQAQTSISVSVKQKEIALQWNNIQDRVENDGKSVTATATGIVNSDIIEIVLSDNANVQTVGSHTVTAQSITGNDAVWYKLPSNNSVTFSIEEKPVEIKDIKKVDITDINNPTALQQLDVSAITNTEGVNGTDLAVSWLKNGQEVNGNADFESIYTAKIALTAKSGYTFADDVTATVNGQNATVEKADGKIVVTYTFEKTSKAKLLEDPNVDDIQLANGADKTVEGLKLPKTVNIKTENPKINTVDVSWNLDNLIEGSYDPSIITEQVFKVKGSLSIPESIDLNGKKAEVTVKITVLAKDVLEVPQADKQSGEYTDNISVALTHQNKDAKIYYTTDGSTPTINSTLYTKPIDITGKPGENVTVVLKAIAVADGYVDSSVVQFNYTVNIPQDTFILNVINGNGSGSYKVGQRVEVIAKGSPENQIFSHWEVTKGDVKLEDINSSKTYFVMPNSDVEIKACYKDITNPQEKLPILDGDNQEVVQGQDVVIRIDNDPSNLLRVEINGQLVDSSNYTISYGSTIITLKKDFVDSLGLGTHDIKVQFKNGYAQTTFNVKEEQKPVDPQPPIDPNPPVEQPDVTQPPQTKPSPEENKPSDEKQDGIVKTGDHMDLGLYLFGILISMSLLIAIKKLKKIDK